MERWKTSEWTNPIIDKDIFITKSTSVFPSPDCSFYSPSKKILISLEFKPQSETQRGILTGLGQTIAYLNKASASYLVIPNVVEHFEIGEYLEKTFKKYIYGKMPIGLITYKNDDITKIILRCDIADKQQLLEKEIGTDTNYWAAWRDTTPHAIYLLLKIASETTSRENRAKLIWDKYYFNYFCPIELRSTLEEVPSKVIFWGGKIYQMPLQQIKNKLKLKVAIGILTEEAALKELTSETDVGIADNHYHDLKKNHYNYMNHLELWDSEFNLTELGKRLLSVGTDFTSNQASFIDELAKITLVEGRHWDLISDCIDIIKQNKELNEDNIRDVIYESLEKKGFVKKNSNRTITGVRKFLSSELDLWNKLGLIFKNGSRYFWPDIGYKFDFDRINLLTKDYYENN